MSLLEWILSVLLITFYLTCLLTVCRLTFQKGHMVLGLVGIFIPFLWLIGAILPAKTGSQFDIAQQTARNTQYAEYTR